MPTFIRWFLLRILLPLAALFAVMVGLGLLITKGLDHTWPLTAEDGLNRELAADRTPTWNAVTNVLTVIANTPVIIAVTAVVAGVLRLVFKRWRESLFLIGAVTAQATVFLLTTLVIDRRRPAVPHLDASPPTSSFPSGHTSAAVALYCGIALVLTLHARSKAPSVLWWTLLLAIPVAVATSRLYRGMHHPSDVAASFVNGFSCLAVMSRAILARGAEWGRDHVHAARGTAGRLAGRS